MLSFLYYFSGGGNQKQWSTLQHNGPMFAEEYIYLKIPIIVNNKKIILSPLGEEYAMMFSKFIGTKYMDMNVFKRNFWKDFKTTIKDLNINSLDDIDFSLMKEYIDLQKNIKINLTKEAKLDIKSQQKNNEEIYSYCFIDGIQQNVGNYKVEPPGIFLGRGTHPKLGRIKKRIYPEDVTLNLDKNAQIPKIDLPGHKWGNIVHDHNVIWLATWKENISDKNKYVFTSLDSLFKSKSDEEKFNLAKKLKKKINSIREIYELQLTSVNDKDKQLATALYFIDNLALRVGGKKDSKEEADTVGVTSLRVEHINLLENNTIKLDFLGKDSVRYCKKISVHTNVYNNLFLFIKDKSKKDSLFNLISASNINDYLTSLLKGLTTKVWRTYNASFLFQKELDKLISTKKLDYFKEPNERLNFLLSIFNQANAEVALLCNHQKSINTNLDVSIEKINGMIKKLKKSKLKYKDIKNNIKVKQIECKIKLIKMKKDNKLKMKNISLSTSKNNYIDPRIIFAFIKKYDIPPEKLFTEQLLKKFAWASLVDKDYKF